MQNNKGYTVIELLAVMVIIGILAMSSAMVARTLLPRSYISSALNTFSSDYSYARQLASKENRFVAIVFNTEGTSYSVLSQQTVGTFGSGAWVQVKQKNNIKPMAGKKFIKSPTNFAVNSMGEVRDYPDCTSLIAVTLDFFYNAGNMEFESQVKLYQSGGIKVEKITLNQ